MATGLDLTVAETARVMLGAAPDSVERAGGGRNSRIYRLRMAGNDFVLKVYPPPGAGSRDRLTAERDALLLMARHGINQVPRVIAADPVRRCLLLNWIDGMPIESANQQDIVQAIEFLNVIHKLRSRSDAQLIALAAEACLSGAEIMAQIDQRMSRLEAVSPGESTLAVFLKCDIRPALVAVTDWVKSGLRRIQSDMETTLPEADRSLCPSDFGFHNALRGSDGRLTFLDFDYFGWDDPVKLVSDFLLHPGMSLTEESKYRFVEGAQRVYGSDPCFELRLRLLYPLFGLRWCMILLNEFLPERWTVRLHAGTNVDWAATKQAQLDRAANLLQVVVTNFRCFPYER